MSQLLVRQSLLKRDRLRSAIPESEADGVIGGDAGVVDGGVPEVWGEFDAGRVEGSDLFLLISLLSLTPWSPDKSESAASGQYPV